MGFPRISGGLVVPDCHEELLPQPFDGTLTDFSAGVLIANVQWPTADCYVPPVDQSSKLCARQCAAGHARHFLQPSYAE